MKKLLVAVTLAIVLTLTLAAPVFAWDPIEDSNKPGNMPDGPANMPETGRDGVSHGRYATFGNGWFWGFGQGPYSSQSKAQGNFWGPVMGNATLREILGGWYLYYDGETHEIPPLAPGIWRSWVFPY